MGDVIQFPNIHHASPSARAPVDMRAFLAAMAKPPAGVAEAMATMAKIDDLGRRLYEVPTLPGEVQFLKRIEEVTKWMV